VLAELDSGDVPKEQVAAFVDQILDGDISATQAAAIFEEILVSDLTDEQETELVAAVSSAPTAIKNTFEAAIDVYGSGLDDYVPVGSNIDVGARRTLVAATAAISSIAAGVGATGAGRPSAPHDGKDASRPPIDSLSQNENQAISRRQARRMMSRKTSSGTVNHQRIGSLMGENIGAMQSFTRIL